MEKVVESKIKNFNSFHTDMFVRNTPDMTDSHQIRQAYETPKEYQGHQDEIEKCQIELALTDLNRQKMKVDLARGLMLMIHDKAKTNEEQSAFEEKKKLRKSLKHGNTLALSDLENTKTKRASIKSKRDKVPYKSDGDALKLFKENSVIVEENYEDDGDSVDLSQEDDDDMVNMKEKINVNDIDDVERLPSGDSLAK